MFIGLFFQITLFFSEDTPNHDAIRKHYDDGIDPFEFSKLLKESGLMSKRITWIGIDSSYDFAFMLKLVTSRNLPTDRNTFSQLLKHNFPALFDMKHVMECNNLKGDLQAIADQLKIRRFGSELIAGGDSYITGMAYFKMREVLNLFFQFSLFQR